MIAAATPARQQYLDIKTQYPDSLLWFRLGDFYEMFDDDARVAAAALRITLTSRSFGKDCRVPMCGVPVHAQARFLARLVRQGFSVAICDQVSQPGRGLVQREVVRVVTPGTIGEPELLRPGENNYLAAVAFRMGSYALAYADVSTGEFRFTESQTATAIVDELQRLQVAECLMETADVLPDAAARHVRVPSAAVWDELSASERLQRHVGARALHVIGCIERPAAIAAAGAVLAYIEQTNRALLNIMHLLQPYSLEDIVAIDPTTRAMLLGRAPRTGERDSSLAGLLDRTCNVMGSRLLTRWLRRPLRDRTLLLERQSAIAEFLADGEGRTQLRAALRPLADLERLTARIGQQRATTDDLMSVARTLELLPEVRQGLGKRSCPSLQRAAEEIDPAADVAAGIRAAVAEPGASRLIRPGFDSEIDLLAATADELRTRLAELEPAERARTGIRSLKVSYNQVFGYYIEVTSANLARVPPHYVRKQTLAHAERFVTPDLLCWEAELQLAEAQLQELDQTRFSDLQAAITAQATRLLHTAEAVGYLDVVCALAEAAEEHHLCRPELVEGDEIAITQGRHPMVEAALGPGAFIPNDCVLGGGQPAMAVVTGPNMGGKSTYLRQMAVIVYLAQVGCYVPAASARIGLADRIFARVGAHDDLAAGHSTFLVEMAETAAIVRLATPQSLVLLDEIGRGTSTYDGLAIAQAVAEHLHEVVGARTLFATHYYELAGAAEQWTGARNLHVCAEEHESDVVFLYRVEPGIADKSYALHVAKLAGMPDPITLRAAELLEAREHGRGTAGQEQLDPVRPGPAGRHALPVRNTGVAVGALRLAEAPPGITRQLLDELLTTDLINMTPLDALNTLYHLQQRARASAQGDQAATLQARDRFA